MLCDFIALVLIAGLCCTCCQVVSFQAHEAELRIANGRNINLGELELRAESPTMTLNLAQLVCREQVSQPSGVESQANRDIGLALVLIEIKNHQEMPLEISIQDVDIRSDFGNYPRLFNFEPRIIRLQPLENASVDIHLSNQTGYGKQHEVVAVITYEMNGETYVIQSNTVVVVRT